MYNPNCIFGPTMEDESKDAIVTMHPMVALENGRFRDIPAIMQVVKDEGLLKTLGNCFANVSRIIIFN